MLLVSGANEIKFHTCEDYDIVQAYKPTDNSSLHRSISWCRDGSLLSLVTTKGNAEIIRTKEDVKLLQTVTGIGPASAIAFQKTTKKNVALGTVTGAVHVYDIKSRSSKKVFTKSGDTISILEWNCVDSHLGVLNTRGVLSLFNNNNNVKSGTVEIKQSNTISTFRFHQKHKNLLACASDEGGVSVWDCNISKSKFFVKSHAAPVTDLVFSPQNDTLLTSTSLDRSFNCYDIKQNVVALTVTTCQPLSTIDMALNGTVIAVGSIRGVILIYDLRKYNAPLSTVQAHDSEIKRILFQPQGGHLNEVTDIPEDTIVPTAPKNLSGDSFASIFDNINEFSPKVDLTEPRTSVSKKRTESLTDSFLVHLASPTSRKEDNYSIDKLKDMSNLKITEGIKKWIDSRNIMDTSDPHCSGLLEFPQDVVGHLQKASTPIFNNKLASMSVHEDIQDSPIVSSNLVSDINSEELKKIVKETVNETIDYRMNELMDSMHQYYLNLHMSYCRQAVVQESLLKKLLSVQFKDSQTEILKEENEFLKKKLSELMEKNK